MTNDTWIMLQVFVAGCTGMAMWGIVWVVADMWNKATRRRQTRRP